MLKQKIVEIHEQSRGTYGSPRVTEELEAHGFKVGRKRVARRMAELGLSADLKPKFRNVDSEPTAEIAANVLERQFEVDEPDRVWVGDITCVWTVAGWLYLAVVIDLSSRRVVGWAMADHMRAELVLEALSAALGLRWDHVQHEPSRQLPGQRGRGVLLRDAETRARLPHDLSHSRSCDDISCRMDRSLRDCRESGRIKPGVRILGQDQ
jgi:putative transposase